MDNRTQIQIESEQYIRKQNDKINLSQKQWKFSAETISLGIDGLSSLLTLLWGSRLIQDKTRVFDCSQQTLTYLFFS